MLVNPNGCGFPPIEDCTLLRGRELLAGRGMGLARVDELNHSPGPTHVPQLRDKPAFSPGQLDSVQASFRRMEAITKPLSADLLARERKLDAAFRDATVTTARMAADAEAIDALQGRLQAVRMAVYLDMRAVLTLAQVAAYDELRGYAGVQAPPPAHGHHMPPGCSWSGQPRPGLQALETLALRSWLAGPM